MMVEQVIFGMVSPAYPIMGADTDIFITPISTANVRIHKL
jgi:hypothetical protein